jgi:hypothetical protein
MVGYLSPKGAAYPALREQAIGLGYKAGGPIMSPGSGNPHNPP